MSGACLIGLALALAVAVALAVALALARRAVGAVGAVGAISRLRGGASWFGAGRRWLHVLRAAMPAEICAAAVVRVYGEADDGCSHRCQEPGEPPLQLYVANPSHSRSRAGDGDGNGDGNGDGYGDDDGRIATRVQQLSASCLVMAQSQMLTAV